MGETPLNSRALEDIRSALDKTGFDPILFPETRKLPRSKQIVPLSESDLRLKFTDECILEFWGEYKPTQILDLDGRKLLSFLDNWNAANMIQISTQDVFQRSSDKYLEYRTKWAHAPEGIEKDLLRIGYGETLKILRTAMKAHFIHTGEQKIQKA